MLQKPCGFWAYLPIRWIRYAPPGIHMGSDLVYHWNWIVHLLGGRKASALVKDQMAVLCRNALLFSGFWNGGDVRRLATVAENFLRRLSFLVRFPVAGRAGVGGIQYRMVEKVVSHTWFSIKQ